MILLAVQLTALIEFKEGLGGEEIRFLGSWEYCRDPLSRAVVHGGERLVAGVAALKQRLRGRSPW